MKRFLLLFIWTLPVCAQVRADDYYLDLHPMQSFGNQGQEPFNEPSDPKVCELYLQNLRYFAKRKVAMSCERPIAPHLQDRIKKIVWHRLDPNRHPELFRAVVAALHNWHYAPPKDEQEAIAWYANEVTTSAYVFRRATARLDRSTGPSAETAGGKRSVQYVQYGPNRTDPNNPRPAFRCKPRRGGPASDIASDLPLYLASDDLKSIRERVLNIRNGGSGEAVRLIDKRPYVETADPEGHITLFEIADQDPSVLEPVCRFVFEFDAQ